LIRLITKREPRKEKNFAGDETGNSKLGKQTVFAGRDGVEDRSNEVYHKDEETHGQRKSAQAKEKMIDTLLALDHHFFFVDLGTDGGHQSQKKTGESG